MITRPAILFILLTILLTACSSANTPAATEVPAASAASQAVSGYLAALTAKDPDKISTFSCADWEDDALMEMDSFAAVETKLDSLTCQEDGKEGDSTLVKCTGKIITTYNDENQELDLSSRVFVVTQQGGESVVCGYR